MNDPLKKLSWDDLRIVKVIGEAGNLAAAAGRIGINTSTAFRRLGEIEAVLDRPLFERRRSGYVPTPAGEELVALAQRLEVDIVSVTRRITGQDQDEAGEIRIATSDTFATWLLPPVLAGFTALHPGARVEVVVGNGALNLARGESDVALRATDDPPENLVGRRVARIAWAPYRQRRAHDEAGGHMPDDLAWAAYCDELAGLKANRHLETRVPAERIVFRTNTVQGMAATLAAGLGAGWLPCLVGDALPDLARLGPADDALSDGLWLLTHPDLRKSGRVHVFLEYCAAALTKRRPFIEGRGIEGRGIEGHGGS
ncbi:LysR family transcriptional regulator [Tistrella mobilis]|uniref:LysR family transcriptional regulator n=1 Tax=Tistrella mobilis TaxID=171437 RepID=UPI0035575BB4